MHRLCTILGLPQHRFASIHVVGTNGKSSVARMTAALLEAHGLAAGACLSPHSSCWAERILIRGERIAPGDFAAAVGAVAEAATVVERGLEPGEAVTQFEVATAVAFVAFAAARLDAAAIEAGLGGRLDATNTIPARVAVLTSIGLDHTEWLGDTRAQIAAEKLAVLRDSATLVVGALDPESAELAERVAAERGARLVRAPDDLGPGVRVAAPGGFQRRNFALAVAAAEAFLGEGALDSALVSEVAGRVSVPGRLERIAERPAVLVDAAHNPDGAAALAEAIPTVAGAGPVVGVLAVLADKDAEGIARALAPALDRVVCAELPVDGPKSEAGLVNSSRRRSWAAGDLARACSEAGLRAEAEPDLGLALERARALAAASDPPGTVLVAGSHYALGPARAALG